MEIRHLEVDLDSGVLKINGREFTEEPIVVTLPGAESWPLSRLFNSGKATGNPEEYSELTVAYCKTNNML